LYARRMGVRDREGLRRQVYAGRVNAVIDYIERNLAEELTLETLAGVAHFSPFHFHRVFSAMVGETLNDFVSRLRVERAASLLVQYPRMTITAVASAAGFSTPSSFARVFRERFGQSASAWRRSQVVSGVGFVEPGAYAGVPATDARAGIVEMQADARTGSMTWTIRAGSLGMRIVRIEKLAPLEVAYVRRTGPYQGMAPVYAEAFGALVRWAQPQGLVKPDSVYVSIAHDDARITPEAQHRISVCLVVPPETEASGEVGRMTVDGGTFAVCRFEVDDTEYAEAWQAVMAGWLPESGYEPDNVLPYERFDATLQAATPGKQVVDICVPVRRVRD